MPHLLAPPRLVLAHHQRLWWLMSARAPGQDSKDSKGKSCFYLFVYRPQNERWQLEKDVEGYRVGPWWRGQVGRGDWLYLNFITRGRGRDPDCLRICRPKDTFSSQLPGLINQLQTNYIISSWLCHCHWNRSCFSCSSCFPFLFLLSLLSLSQIELVEW